MILKFFLLILFLTCSYRYLQPVFWRNKRTDISLAIGTKRIVSPVEIQSPHARDFMSRRLQIYISPSPIGLFSACFVLKGYPKPLFLFVTLVCLQSMFFFVYLKSKLSPPEIFLDTSLSIFNCYSSFFLCSFSANSNLNVSVRG